MCSYICISFLMFLIGLIPFFVCDPIWGMSKSACRSWRAYYLQCRLAAVSDVSNEFELLLCVIFTRGADTKK